MQNNTKTQSRPKLLFLVPAISQTHKSLENSQDFLSTPRPRPRLTSRPRPRQRLWVSRPRPRLYFLSSRRLETKTLVSRTTSLRITDHFLCDFQHSSWHCRSINTRTLTAGHVKDVTVLIVFVLCCHMSMWLLTREFSRFFLVLCILKYLLRTQCKYNVSLWNKDLVLQPELKLN